MKRKHKLTFNDLKNIDYFLTEQQRIINQPKENRKLVISLREKIILLMDEIEVKVT